MNQEPLLRTKSACICEWPDACNGTGVLHCDGCGGDLCVCKCGGEQPCYGCGDCEGGEAEDYPEDAPVACSICSCLIGHEVGYGDTWDGQLVCENCAGVAPDDKES